MPLYPAIVNNTTDPKPVAQLLEPISLEKPPYNEAWLQNLIQENPSLLPAGEMEACFENIIPVLVEYSLPSGYMDNFYITPDGYPVLVEVKLWKNQEARRKVVAQILEYAKDFAALSYEDINREIRKLKRDREWGANPLHEIASTEVANPLPEAIFVDRVTRNLREGRFLLLVVGDGVREEMAALAEYLMRHSLRYAFGMIEVRLFHMPDGSVLAMPRLLSKTQIIEHHVAVLSMPGSPAMRTERAAIVSEQKTSFSADEFYELLAKNDPQHVVWLKDLLGKLSDLPIDLQTGSRGESLMLKVPLPDGGQVQVIAITPTAAQFWGVPNKHWKDPAWQRLAREYLGRITSAIPGVTIKEFSSGLDIKYNDKPVPLTLLHGRTGEIAEAIHQVLRDAEAYAREEA